MEYTMENFMQNKLAINCKTQDEADRLMEIFDSQKIKWKSGESVLEDSKWECHEGQTYYALCETGLVFSYLPALLGRTTISFQEFTNDNKSNKEKVLGMIGVKLGKPFNIVGDPYNPYTFDDNDNLIDKEGEESNYRLFDILWEKAKIEKIPEDPNTEAKKHIELISREHFGRKNIQEAILFLLNENLSQKEPKSA